MNLPPVWNSGGKKAANRPFEKFSSLSPLACTGFFENFLYKFYLFYHTLSKNMV